MTASFANPVLVIGSGLAGLMTALSLAPLPVLLVTRALAGGESSSQWAQGGVAAALGADDDAERHGEDTLAAGDGLCDSHAVRAVTGAARSAIEALQSFGVRFDFNPDGTLAAGLEAAHSRRRILHVGGDGSGAEIVRALVARAQETPSIRIVEASLVRHLLTRQGSVCGALVTGPQGDDVIAASRIVLATGGLGGLFEATTNPCGHLGQGVALAARAGAVLADMEFVQFHPTALEGRTRPLGLISEAVRGEGAILVNERGERFMSAWPGAELAARDVVARAISAQLQRGGKVFLDARAALGHGFAARFPAIHALCMEAGVDPAVQPVPVRPAAHYHMGGVLTDLNGRTSLSGLWAAGEVACTGLHGANRLASNSLLEAAVMGARVAADIRRMSVPEVISPVPVPACCAQDDGAEVRAITSAHLGVLRHEAGVRAAVEGLLPLATADGPQRDAAIVALCMAVFAHERRESRGAHARTDYPLPQADASRQFMGLDAVLVRARAILSHSHARSA
ncbi:L-aspartate oxidase [Allorhizobium undicola]|uniref:L-aspartate oxidase n=1 Tax=Allorhizobium undicola TaxID=78527 RepID=UPI003D329FA3